MSLEIEKKYRLTDDQFEQVELDLIEYKAEFVAEEFEENLLFGNDYMKDIGALLRIRKIENKTVLTFKKHVPSESGIKQHIEHETLVEDADEIQKIVENLGLEMRMVYEKRRKTWKFRNVEVVLDVLPFGLYMEIEGSLTAIGEAEMFLDAQQFEVEPATYPFLTKHLGRRIENRIESRFGNKDE